ncbi:MAG: ornithine cyclodeaminase family protein [Bryobacterales bacterium]|nr:ornithine cyclodeaminase family protein [Bryobacteraceae bacterium]MDW8353774.1 ornithine cyclodeaminase family protein [Bryobacterales bacterium]
MLWLSESDVVRLLPMAEAIGQMRAAFEDLARGEASNQPRRRLVLPSGAVLHSMAGAWGGYFGAKIYSTHPGSGAHFLVLLYRAEDGRPLALIEANHLGQIRTGATTGLATDLLAAPEASTVGLIGSGFQARAQLEAVAAVRQLRRIRVWSPTREHRERFAAEQSEKLGVEVRSVGSAREAVEDAEIVVTATSAREPVLEADWVAAGAHVNAVGSNQPRRRELPAQLVRRADLIVVDSVEQARIESGDLLLAFADDDWRRLVELKDLVAGRLLWERPPGKVSVFKSNGLGLEDVAAAALVYRKAVAEGCGRELPLFHS